MKTLKVIILIVVIWLVWLCLSEAQSLSFDLSDYNQRIDFVVNHQARSHYSLCGRCGLQWRYVKGHNIIYYEGEGFAKGLFAICEYCWGECTTNERIFYYKKRWEEQLKESDNNYYETKASWERLKANIIKESEFVSIPILN